ncbi:MAG: hypothetical protein EXS59_02060 [Candidatus Taylorbacteria bacterium]|nr:hypothetical protein [Candidatus Taylorbacteria bacterium]
MENNNTNTTAWVWAIVAVIVIGGLILIANKVSEQKPQNEENVVVQNETGTVGTTTVTETVKPATTVKRVVKTTSVKPKPANNVVRYTSKGFEPSILEIKRGESVEFVNLSDKAMVIKSHDETPVNFYPGFSQESGPLGKGGKFYFAFTLPGTWFYYNLNGNKEQGIIIVK